MLRRLAIVAAALAALAAAAWYITQTPDEGDPIRKRLQAFAYEVNNSTVDGLGTEARAAKLGAFFTEDAEVDLGRGAAPIKGRETLIGMAGRLQPRTSAFSLRFEDITVAMAPGGQAADVHLTAEFIRRSITTGDQSLDAREFTIDMRRVENEWRMHRVTAVDTLK
ncbi:MAG TPA: nuclear transport factor 2 family protein [Vicinamibacterales bacterium]|jgi:hypothetical protein